MVVRDQEHMVATVNRCELEVQVSDLQGWFPLKSYHWESGAAVANAMTAPHLPGGKIGHVLHCLLEQAGSMQPPARSCVPESIRPCGGDT